MAGYLIQKPVSLITCEFDYKGGKSTERRGIVAVALCCFC